MTLSIVAAERARLLPPPPIPLLRTSSIPHAEREVHLGTLIRVRRGIVASTQLWKSLPPWERYVARVHAVTMTHPDAVMCLESAAVLLGLPVIGEPPDVHVLDVPGATSRLSGGIRVHTTVGDRGLVDLGATRVTSVMDTAIDLARSRHPAVGLTIADASLRQESWLSVEALVAHNEARIGSRGRRHARWALHRASGDAETALESVSRAAIEWLGFPEPILQQVFTIDDHVDRCDLWWPYERVIGEADGELKYDGSLQDPVFALRREKARDARLRTVAAGIAHWSWADVARVAPVRSALIRAGLRPIRPESSPDLVALGSLLSARPTP